MTVNDCICCSERKLIKRYLRISMREGIPLNKFPTWLHRKHGDLVIWRPRKDGVMGASMPCVMCRKAVEKYHIQWVAYTGEKWLHSNQDEMPKSRPTNKQRRKMGFKSM